MKIVFENVLRIHSRNVLIGLGTTTLGLYGYRVNPSIH